MRSLKEQFHEEAADELAARDLIDYVDVLGRIEVVDELMDHLTFRLNEGFEQLTDHCWGLNQQQATARVNEQEQEKIAALKKRFSWEENEPTTDASEA